MKYVLCTRYMQVRDVSTAQCTAQTYKFRDHTVYVPIEGKLATEGKVAECVGTTGQEIELL